MLFFNYLKLVRIYKNLATISELVNIKSIHMIVIRICASERLYFQSEVSGLFLGSLLVFVFFEVRTIWPRRHGYQKKKKDEDM